MDECSQIGNQIVEEIKNRNNPHIDSAILDDYNDYSGQIVVNVNYPSLNPVGFEEWAS